VRSSPIAASRPRPGAELLRPYRALDLTDELGELAGRILADLGADVIKVEPPDGDRSRWRPPFRADVPDAEGSLAWWAANRNKRSVTLQLESADGQQVFKHLVQTADFVLESFPPGYLDNLGLGYHELRAINARVILTSITPFGRHGPYSQYAASDLTLQALGGFLYVNGEEDRPPVRISADLAYYHGGGQGAAGALVAHYQRQRSGCGQHVDVSIQDYIAWTPLDMTMAAQIEGKSPTRAGAGMRFHTRHVAVRTRWRCKDGYITFGPLGGGGGKPLYTKFVAWMREHGFVNPILTARDWAGEDLHSMTQAEYDAIAAEIQAFLETRTVAELYAKAVSERMMLAPAASARDIVESPQIVDRQALVAIEHAELGQSFRYPGAFARFSATPIDGFRRPPRIGEHNQAVYVDELGYTRSQLEQWRQRGVV
jgi:crotonobetainyl-CoA:carnitine CoA-transferase CaiB-like acyl-CoA transferase